MSSAARLVPFAALVALAVLAAFTPARTRAQAGRSPFDALHFRDIGPAASDGRIHDLQIDPKNPAILYAAAASGGIWNYYWDSELRAIRKGVYKAHFITSGAYGDGEPRTVHNPPLLFNLAENPGERDDIAAMRPDTVADLVKEAETHRGTVVAPKPLFDQLLPASQGQQR